MSHFNLDRFRFSPKNVEQKSPGSEENLPQNQNQNQSGKAAPGKGSVKSSSNGVVFLDDDSDEHDDILFVSEVVSPDAKHSSSKNSAKSQQSSICAGTDLKNSHEEKVKKLLAMFPQLHKSQVQEVVENSSTLEGAVAACLLRFGDKEQGTKRKMEESSSSEAAPAKKRKPSLADDDDWEKHEAMVKRLQRKFPDQDKEELRSVLQEHDWKYTEALQALEMFSCSENESSTEKSKDKRNKKPNQYKAISDSDVTEDSDDEVSFISEVKVSIDSKTSKQTQETTTKKPTSAETTKEKVSAESDGTRDSSDIDSGSDVEGPKLQNGPLSSWLQKSPKEEPAGERAESPVPKITSVISLAKVAAAKRKERATVRREDSSGEEDDEDEDERGLDSSGLDDSDDELETKGAATDVKTNILNFFNEASIDELNLISGCSLKKGQRIIELRPFDNWETLVDVIHKGNGLSEDLLVGCKNVLKERKVVLGLMSKCETISSKLIRRVTELMESGSGSFTQPQLLNSDFQLKPYQFIGLKWLLLLNEHKLSCILADEMGLGKTIQAIAFLAQLYEDGVTGPHLITVPASTLDNWVRELKLWCPTLNVIVYYGSAEDRRYLKYDILNGEIEFDVIVTTYSLAIGNDSDRSLFRKLRLAYAIFDEGHMLKNMNTLRYRHLMAINAKHRLLLTGTPLQNNLLELMSLLNFIMPSMFSDSTLPLSKMFSMKSHEEQSKFERQRISQAKRIMKPFILRRVKNEVLQQLPAKEERVEYCPMSPTQEQQYRALFTKLKASKTCEKRELCNVMMQLRKMANHPLLHRHHFTIDKLKAMSKLMLKEPTHHDADPQLIREDMEVMSDFELHNLCKQYNSISSYRLDTSVLIDSGKFKHLAELLSTIQQKGDRVVLFSQFTMMLDIVEVFLKHLNHRYVRLDGATPIADRIVLIDKYNSDRDIFVFLLSTKAGGLGINLTSANVVILHDIDCNPYNDKQAEDRCHRVGQTKTVQVIKLISKDTIEDCMLQLGQKKLKLEQDMTTADEAVEGTIPEDMATLLKASLGL